MKATFIGYILVLYLLGHKMRADIIEAILQFSSNHELIVVCIINN